MTTAKDKTAAATPVNLLRQPWEVVKTVVDSGVDADYLALGIDNVVCGLPVAFDVFLKTKVTGETARAQYVICCPANEVFPLELRKKLITVGIDRVYVHQRHRGQASDYLLLNLSRLLEDDDFPMTEKFHRVYDVTRFWLQQLYTDDQNALAGHLQTGQELVGNLLACVMKDPFSAGWLVDYCHHDAKLYTHCLNTCVMGLAFTRYLGWSYLKIRDFGLGALFHDIGLTRVSPEILNKPEGLSPAEQDQIRRHPSKGFALIKPFPSIGKDSLMVILQHHENGDGSGYPEGLSLASIEPVAKVMRILDSYDALLSPRSWRPKFEPIDALRAMNQELQEKGIYDKQFFLAFIKFLAR